MNLRDRVILVTGGGRGLGEAICRDLSESGAMVLVCDVREDLARGVSDSIRKSGNRSAAVHLDVLDSTRAARAVDDAIDRYGGIDVLVNNAGVDLTVPVDELSVEQWDRILNTNLRGPFVLSRSVLPHMRKKRDGHILNIVSTAAKRAWPNASAYHASKWGLLGFSHALHVEARPHNVRVTALICGGMRTPFLLERFPDIDQETLQDPKNVAETVRHVLTSPAGTVIPEIMAIPLGETSWP